MNKLDQDRRTAPRRVLRTRASLASKDGLRLDVRTLDLSSAGMGILSDGPLVPGSIFVLRCLVPSGGARKELVVSARVIHSVFSGAEGGFIVGLAFVEPSVEVAQLVASVLRC